jgi:hemerythrin superfamily protein
MADAAHQDAIALLKADHAKVDGLFKDYEKARGLDRKRALALQICTELTVHTTIEEEIFYPACRGAVKDDKLDEAYVEHDAAKVLMAQLEASDAGEDFFDAKVKVLSEEITHHVEEEEKRMEGIFAQARHAGLDMDALGVQLAARKQELMEKIDDRGLSSPSTRTFGDDDLKQGEVRA